MNLDLLPSLPFSACGQLPNCSAVYVVSSSNGKCIYVGSTLSLTHRFIRHDKRELFTSHEASKITWAEADKEQLILLERHFIQELQPLLNRRMPTGKGIARVGMIGGSLVVRIPQHIARELCLEKGEEVAIETSETGHGFYIERIKPVTKGKSK